MDVEKSRETLQRHLKYLSRPGNRFKDIDGIKYKAEYIKSIVKGTEFECRSQSFSAWGTEGQNIIVTINSSIESEIKTIIGAHYDTVPHSPGANDNMSAVGCLLTLIEEMANETLKVKNHLEICFWDMEEVGKKGSEVYIKNLDRSENYVAIVLEMIGCRYKKPFSQKIPFWTMVFYPRFYATSLLNLNRADFHLVIGRTNDFDSITSLAPLFPSHRIITAPTNLALSNYLGLCDSDHHNFWVNNIPAILITDTGRHRSRVYHTPRDSVDNIDVDFVLEVLGWLFASFTSKELSKVGLSKHDLF